MCGDVGVEAGKADLHIRKQPYISDSQGQEAEEGPSEKPQAEAAEFPLVPAHNFFAFCDGFERADGVVFGDDVVGLGIGQGGDDAGNDEEKGPQENENVLNDVRAKSDAEFLKSFEYLPEVGVLISDNGKGKDA